MKQFVLGSAPGADGLVELRGGDYRHLALARRLAPGECFPALLPDGSKATVRVRSVGGGALVGEVAQGGAEAPSAAAGRATAPIILFQGIPRGEKMSAVVRQAAEGGLDEIVPFESEFSDVRLSGRNGGQGGSKFSRWERIVKEARQQSGSPTATAVRRPMSADGLFGYWERIKAERPGALGLLFHHLPLADAGASSLHRYLGADPEAVVLAVGPEGGFSPAEAERFLAAGFKPFTIGDTILRAETAALYAQAAVRILLLERDSWMTK
jgi:16S rRNA (uracil1498-N3)-methyltransferase